MREGEGIRQKPPCILYGEKYVSLGVFKSLILSRISSVFPQRKYDDFNLSRENGQVTFVRVKLFSFPFLKFRTDIQIIILTVIHLLSRV